MSLSKVFPFTIDSNYIVPSGAQILGGKASLKLIDNLSQIFEEPYDSGVGFTGDTDKVTFTGNIVQQNEKTYNEELIGISAVLISDADRAVGVKTAVANNGASLTTINGNKYLDVSGEIQGKYFSYDANNVNFEETGAIRFKILTGYGNLPTSNRFMFYIGSAPLGGGELNTINFFHQSTGDINIRIHNQVGVLVSATFHPWAGASSIIESEIELNCDFTNGSTRLFIDGVQSGPTISGAFNRTGITSFLIGGRDIAGGITDYYIRDCQVFDEPQHTTNFPEEIPRFVPNYQEASITLPQFVYTGLGSIQSFDNFISAETGNPRYIINGLYWNGSMWITSNGTYIQSNSGLDINTNIGTLPVSDVVTIKLIFDETTLINSVDNTKIGYTGQVYTTDDQEIEFIDVTRLEKLEGFAETNPVISGSDTITYRLSKDNVKFYHNGVDWVESVNINQSNTAAEVEANKSTFTTVPVSTKIFMILKSDDGLSTPELEAVTITYDFSGNIDPCELTIVFGFLINADCTISTEAVSAQLNNDPKIYQSATQISGKKITVQTDPNNNGSWEIELISTDDMTNAYYEFVIRNTKYRKLVPKQEFISFNDLVNYE